MKFNKNNIAVISLIVCAALLMATMISIFFIQSDITYEDNTKLLLLSVLLLCVAFCSYSLSIFKRVKPVKTIYVSYSFEDEEIAEKIILQLSDQFPRLSKYKFSVVSKKDVHYGEDLYQAIRKNISKSDIFILIISYSYLQKESCIKEFQDICEKRINSNSKIIPIVLDSFDNLYALPKDLRNIKSLTLAGCSSDEEFSQRIKMLALDLIRQRKD